MDYDTDTRCPGCFAEKGRANPCPQCGYDETAQRATFLLPHRTLLNGQFVVGRVLGKPGGFGVTYLGWDLSLATRVAIKEYLPRDLVGRTSDRATLAPHSRDEDEQFRFGLDQFMREARTLAQIDHPNIVRVRQFFEANGTAYLVMDYYRGLSLAEYLERHGGRLPEDRAKAIMVPILDGLRAVHAKGFLHRDIKPQNIYLARTESGGARPLLLDFGAARQAMGERSQSLSVVLTPGFAPFEQYHRKGRQGPWTDIYGAAAVLYLLVTGETPPEANERMAGDELKPAATFGISQTLSDALGAALTLAPEARPQTVPEFQARLAGREARQSQVPALAEPSAAPPPPRIVSAQPPLETDTGPIALLARPGSTNMSAANGPARRSVLTQSPIRRVPLVPVLLLTTLVLIITLVTAKYLEGRDRDAEAQRALLAQEFTIRVAQRPGTRSGVWRVFPGLDPEIRNYYIIVEAVDPSGRILKVPIQNEETGKTEIVDTWGLRVDQQTFEAVRADKLDDGVIEYNRFGYKIPGELTPRYRMNTTGGAITRW